MLNLQRMTKRLKLFVNRALACPGVDPDTISDAVLSHLSRVRTSAEEQEAFAGYIRRHSLQILVHFTSLRNVPSIVRFGLIPRHYLQNEAIALPIPPVYSDQQRYDGHRDSNCISISFPNYRMLYRKRKEYGGDWAVVVLDSSALREHRCNFSPTNSARRGATPKPGLEAAETLFGNPDLRRQLDLPDAFTTDPQAEVLDQSVLPPRWIKELHVQSSNAADWLSGQLKRFRVPPISIRVDEAFFRPRRDYFYWVESWSRSATRAQDLAAAQESGRGG